MEENSKPPTNEGKHEIKLFFTSDEIKSIENTYNIVKKGGSRLMDKESLMKLLILKETRMYDVLSIFGLSDNGDTTKENP